VKNVTIRICVELDSPVTNLAGSRRSALVLAVLAATVLASGCAAKETAAAPVKDGQIVKVVEIFWQGGG
jgi:excinuclease UvrABC ATPase subunit